MGAAGEVEVARAIYVGADQCRAAVDAVFGEVFVEFFEMAVPVHRGEHDLAVVEQVGATPKHGVELHLLDEYDPHVRLAGVFLRIVDVDRHQMTVFAILRHIGAALFANLLDVRLPRIDEINVLMRELLQQNTILNAHSASANHRVLHAPISSLVNAFSPSFQADNHKISEIIKPDTGVAICASYERRKS